MEKLKSEYDGVRIEIVRFSTEDVITTSDLDETEDGTGVGGADMNTDDEW